MPIFSRQTLAKFEDASAGIPLRQIAGAFEAATIRMSADPGGSGGDRRTQFRRYVAGVDQHDLRQLDRLGCALGALIAEVAASKVDFLVAAAESDGFCFTDRVFRPAETSASSFAVTRLDELTAIDDRGRRLALLANERPNDAIDGAKEVVESVCRTVLRLLGEPPPRTADLGAIAKTTLDAVEVVAVDTDAAEQGAAFARRYLQQLGALIGTLSELQTALGSGHARGGKRNGLCATHARLAVGAAVLFARFVAETYTQRAASKDSVPPRERVVG